MYEGILAYIGQGGSGILTFCGRSFGFALRMLLVKDVVGIFWGDSFRLHASSECSLALGFGSLRRSVQHQTEACLKATGLSLLT